VKEYRDLMRRFNPALPSHLKSGSYQTKKFSPVSLEGFLNAKMLVAVLRRMSPHLERRRIKAVMESFDAFDIGINLPVSFGPQRHQGLDMIYYTTVAEGRSVPLNDWSRWRK
jgi:hypothetical protein